MFYEMNVSLYLALKQPCKIVSSSVSHSIKSAPCSALFLCIGTASTSIVLSIMTWGLILKYVFHELDIDTVIRNGDVTAFARIRNSVYKHGTSYGGNSSTMTNIPPPQSQYNMPLSATRSPGLYNLTSIPYAQGTCLNSLKPV